jgi:glycosyltransferase involved in cell wall biosynthesis
MMSRPYVTALIDTFNHARFIERAVTSVLEQDFPPSEMELLVVDDGSSDGTPEILAPFAPRLRLLRKPNGGQASAFNFAIPEARGEIIAFLDGDDWWAPEKLARVSEAMRADPQLGLVGHGFTEVRPDGGSRTELLREGFHFRANTVAGARLFRMRKNFLGTSRMTLRAGMARRFLPVPEDLIIEADEYLFTLAAVASSLLILPEYLAFYRIHDSNMFQAVDFTPQGLRRKKEVLASLAAALRRELVRQDLQPGVMETVMESTQADADQLRLLLDGGWPWETLRTEWRLFRLNCEKPTIPHQIFKLATLAPSLLLPPRAYYAAWRRVVRNRFYLSARRKWLPVPARSHVRRFGDGETLG